MSQRRSEDERPGAEMTMDAGQPALYADWRRATLAGRPDTDAELALAVDKHRARVARLRDPFLPIARGDAGARAGERVLWEDGLAFVLVDKFAASLKVLVVPKEEVLFPCDASAQLLAHLAKVAAAVVESFATVAPSARPQCWINPPSGITVRQLHVHVSAGLATQGTVDVDTIHEQVRMQLASRLASAAMLRQE